MNFLASNSSNLSIAIDIELNWIQQALNIAKSSLNSTRKFNIYLQSLAIFAFESWLSQEKPSIVFDSTKVSSFQAPLSNILDVACNLKIGNWQFCLIPTLDAGDLEVRIPRYALQIPEFTAHFYVSIAIDEELEIAVIRGFIDRQRLISDLDKSSALRDRRNWILEKDWNYVIPLSLFELDLQKLLICLQSNADSAIALPQADRELSLVENRAELRKRLPQIADRPLWKDLTWSQAVLVIRDRHLRSWVYRAIAKERPAFDKYLGDLLNILTEKSVNLWDWIQIQQQQIEPELNWQMLPNSNVALTLRNINHSDSIAIGDLNRILERVSQNFQIEIPPNAGKAYQEFALENPFRLYAITWLISEIEKTWSLLIIVTSLPDCLPPYGVKLRISDLNNIVQEQELTLKSGGASLCTYLEATTEDKLSVAISPSDSEAEITRIFEFRF